MPTFIGYENPQFDHEGYQQVSAENHGESLATDRILRGIDAALVMAGKPDADGLSLLDRLEASPMFVKPGR